MGFGIPLIIGFVVGIIMVIVVNMICEKALRLRAVEKGWGYHDPDSGKFTWDNDDAEYVINGISHEDENVIPSVFNLKGIKVKK